MVSALRLETMPRTLRSFRPRGRVIPILLVILALGASAWVFFSFTKPILERKAVEGRAAGQGAGDKSKATAPSAKLSVAQSGEMASSSPPSATPKPAAPPAAGFGFARPLDLGRELARSLSRGELQRAANLLSAGLPDQQVGVSAVLERMMKTMGVKVAPDAAVDILGVIENRTRLAIDLVVPGQQAPARLELDLERDARMGWKVVRIELPKALAAAAAALPALPSGSSPSSVPSGRGAVAMRSTVSPLVVVSQGQDALSFSNDFVRALLRHDFVKARAYVDERRVSTERLAGLCIVFEEGQYEFKPNKPMVITVANPEVSWVIAQVQSPLTQQSTEFGLELQRQGVQEPWRVVGLNLSEILGSFAAAATKLGVPYTPIVKNPTGGESLALYFEYDQAKLHPRAQKQISVVAGLLKSDPGKKLRITGHTDAKGAEDYNLRLSKARAETVRDQLVALGVAPQQVITTGLGKAQPLSPNRRSDGSDDPEGRSRNRRAEIYLDF
jgi:outer membrane protein OmpA-like peptidoglycan-associated protein